MQTAANATAPGTALPPPGPDPATQPLLARIMRGQQRFRELDRRRPWLLDTAISLFLLVISFGQLTFDDHKGGPGPFANAEVRSTLPVLVPYAFVVVLAFTLWWRRRFPAAVYFTVAAVTTVQWAVGIWQPAGISILIALTAVAAYGSMRAVGWAAVVAVAEAVVVVYVLSDLPQPLQGLFFLLGTATAALAIGLTLRTRRMYTAALEDRARRLEIEREQRERLTAAAERARVAREMHDILGHNLSVMVTLADGAARLAANRGESSTEALQILGDTGRQAMDELRRVLGVLREEERDPRSLSPQPGIGDLDALLARVRAAGLPVAYRTSGDLDALGDGVQLTVYRIVQEALTNTLKHAGAGAGAEVDLDAHAARVRVRIIDSGSGASATVPAEDSGHGLAGIRRRAALYGGSVHIGPRTGAPGWVVDVLLDAPPVKGAAR